MINREDDIRLGEVIIPQSSYPLTENVISSGFKVIEKLENGIKVQRINAHYLNSEQIESWVLRWDQLKSFILLPENTQLPLF